jgi:hypothetical protein
MKIKFKIYFIIVIFLLTINLLQAFVPKEPLLYIDIAHQAEYVVVFRPYDNKKYKMRLGVGCLPALFDDLSQDTKIYAVKLGDLLDSYGNGDIGLVYIETPHHKVRCKIVDIQAY